MNDGQLCSHLIKELQHDSEDIRVGLVHFIKQDNGIGTRLQQLGQLTAFFMSHVTRRGANELCHLRAEREEMLCGPKSVQHCNTTGFTRITLNPVGQLHAAYFRC